MWYRNYLYAQSVWFSTLLDFIIIKHIVVLAHKNKNGQLDIELIYRVVAKNSLIIEITDIIKWFGRKDNAMFYSIKRDYKRFKSGLFDSVVRLLNSDADHI